VSSTATTVALNLARLRRAISRFDGQDSVAARPAGRPGSRPAPRRAPRPRRSGCRAPPRPWPSGRRAASRSPGRTLLGRATGEPGKVPREIPHRWKPTYAPAVCTVAGKSPSDGLGLSPGTQGLLVTCLYRVPDNTGGLAAPALRRVMWVYPHGRDPPPCPQGDACGCQTALGMASRHRRCALA
jgi:hypothetical protein